MKVALIPCGSTGWHAEGRLLGRVELPLTRVGQGQCRKWARRLRALGLQWLLHGPDELSTRTAAVLARQLSVPLKMLEDLVEVDLGLWTGLTESQLKTRFASAHRELREAPLNVNPPGGESLSSAAGRLTTCVCRWVKNGRHPIGVVMRPLGFVIARCALEGRELSDVWEAVRQADQPVVIDCSCQASAGPEVGGQAD
jgi:probable phosphoglycerate mutase